MNQSSLLLTSSVRALANRSHSSGYGEGSAFPEVLEGHLILSELGGPRPRNLLHMHFTLLFPRPSIPPRFTGDSSVYPSAASLGSNIN